MDILRAICATHGVFLRYEAEDLGYNDTEIARLVRSGVWHRIRRGAYTFGDVWNALDPADRYRLLTQAVVRQSRCDGVLSHTSALPWHGAPLWGLDLKTVHLTRLDGRSGRHEAGVQQHSGVIRDGDVVMSNGLQVMSPTRAGLEVSCVGSVEATVVVLDYLLRNQLTTFEQLKEMSDAMRRWPNTLTTEFAVRLATGLSESVGESRVYYACYRASLPAPIQQYEVFLPDGALFARLDFAWPEHKVFLEFDGLVKYHRYRREGESIEDAVIREKQREDTIRELTGWTCIRVTWADLAYPERLMARLRRVLGLDFAA